MSFLKDIEENPVKEVDAPVKTMLLQDAKDIYRPKEDIKKIEEMKSSGKYEASDFPWYEKYGLGFGMAFRGTSDLPEEISLFGKNIILRLSGLGRDKQEIERKRLNVITASRNLIKQKQERLKGVPKDVTDDFLYALGGGAFNFSTALLGTFLGGPKTGLAINSALELGSEVSARIPTTKEGEIDEKKITPEWAAKTTAGTIVYTSISALLESKIGIASDKNIWNKPITSTALKQIAKEIGLTAVFEGVTEFLQGGSSAGIRFLEGTITLGEFGEEAKGLWKDFAVASILSSTVGTSVAINQRANLKRAIRKQVDLTVKDKNVSKKIADAIFEAGNTEINTLVSKELELSSELKNKHGLIYQNMGKSIDSAIKESGAFSDIDETELAEYVSDTSQLFADQVLAEANKRGTTIDGVIKGADIKYEDGKIRLKNGENIIAENSVDDMELMQSGVKNDSIRLYRGLEQEFKKDYNLSSTDAPQGYSTWTDNPELAKQYAGENGRVYYIDLPKSELGKEIVDQNGERPLFIDNEKKAGLNNISGKEYLVYTYHDNYDVNQIKEFNNGKLKTDSETININGQEKTVYNSNGDRIAQSKEALENFYKWFGDSKAVDEQGNPLVVYRGLKGDYSVDYKNNLIWASESEDLAYKYSEGSEVNKLYAYYKNPYFERKSEREGKIQDLISNVKVELSDIGNEEAFYHFNKLKSLGNEYSTMFEIWDKYTEFKEALSFLGYDAIETTEGGNKTFAVFNPNQIKSIENEGTFNKNDANIYKQGEKGSFNVSEKAIEITKNADYSTLPHELSHFWLDNIWNYTKTGSASPEYMENFKAIKNWLGITNEQLFLTRKQQEKFAKGYEKYLTEGSLPNRIVGNAFDSYDKWLKKVYKASALKNNLSPEAVEFFRTMTTGEFVEPKNYEPERTFEKNKEKTIETIEKDSKEIITEKQKQYKDEKEFESTTVNKKGISSVFEKQSKRVDSNETLEYDAINLEEQNKLAKEYVENNPEEAKDVINGIKNPPEGIVKNAIYNAYLKQTLDVGDTEAYLDALKNQSLDLTKAGQELVTQRGADDILSGSYWIKKIENGRKKKIVTKTTSYIESFKSDSDINSIFEKKIDDAINNSLDKILKIKDAKEQQKQINILTDMISKDLNVKPEELFQKELKTALDKKEALRKYIRNNLNEKLGISVKVKEAEDILNKVEKVKKVAENTIDKNGNPSVEFFKRLRELEDFTNSLNPTNPITVLTSIIGRASMLASIKSPVVNISSNTINMGLENISRDVVRKLNNESLENKVSKEKQKKYLKYSKDVYNQSGFIVSDMEELETDMKVRGEKITEHSQGKGVIRKIGRFYENTVFKYLMGYPDVFAKDITFVKVAGVDATNIAIKEGAKDITKRANELFDDAIKIEPSTKEGKKIRENAIKEAKIVTYTQDSGLSKFALSLRNIFNKATGPVKIGNVISAFVQVPANVYSLMIDYTFGSRKGLLNAKNIYNDFKNGELSDSSKDSLRATSRNAIGVLASSIILSSLVDDDDDYIPDYALLTPSERAIVKAKNGVFNSVKIGDNYISLEAFGPLAMPLVSLLEARRRIGKREKIAGYFKGAGVQLMSMPVIGDLKDMYEEVSRRLVEKEDKTLESLFDFSIDFLSARTIPAIATDIAKTFDKYERDTMRSSINTVLSKIPLARETLPTKTNMVTGDDIETNPYQLLFGSRVKVANESFEISEIDRLKKNGYNVTITDPTKYGDLKKLSEEDKVIARKRFAEIYSEKIRKIMGRSSWDNLKDEKQAKKLNEIRRKAVEVIKKEFKEQE